MNPSDWTVQKVFDDPYTYNNEHGSFVVYRFFISDGHNDKMVEWTRKSDSPAPQEGEVIHGSYVKDGEYKSGRDRLKFKPEKREGNAPPRNAAPRNGNTGTQQTFSDDRSKRIERQHSQEMAIRYVELLPANASARNPANLQETVKFWTDEFCADLDAYCNSINAQPNGEAKTLEDQVLEPAGVADDDDIPF